MNDQLDTCDNCGKLAELFHNEDAGLAFCEDCDLLGTIDLPVVQPTVTVARETGNIRVDDRPLSPAEAIQLAMKLVQAAELSLYREQLKTPSFHSSEAILRRNTAPLGRAQKALLDIEYDGVRDVYIAGPKFTRTTGN